MVVIFKKCLQFKHNRRTHQNNNYGGNKYSYCYVHFPSWGYNNLNRIRNMVEDFVKSVE